MHGNSKFLSLGELASRIRSGEDPACFFAHGACDLAAVFLDHFARGVPVERGERSGEDSRFTEECIFHRSFEFRGESECDEPVHFFAFRRVAEECANALGDAPADVRNFLQVLFARIQHRGQVLEIPGDVPRGTPSDEPDPEREKKVFEASFLAFLNRGKNVFSALFRHTVKRFQIFKRERVDVGGPFHLAGIQQQGNERRSEIFDVHRFAAHEMFEQALRHRGAVQIFAAEGDFAFMAHERRPAFGAYVRRRERYGSCGAFREIHVDDLRNDFSAFSTPTVSPTRRSSLATSSKLWSVARLTVVPASLTGARFATGVTAPVRPTWKSTESTGVYARSALNL